ncbi:tRNA dihydrouridine(20/20a) synthase DusA [Psychrobacter sanguinis]|uniref:tRNA dihydrouridine(20/20a) synthase DusA n=1 Tax=Psychrobacter sanguinis TaxID=861445 RepID=UPI00020C9895|nr:tRNA dihydrouridine(20/20a) synthase DusA [Psychrobacter sanguinis]EGK09980.1 tRNA dihydrouridine synthase A [Psychrobacter sp. 1501(2011)]MCC3307215.1 tRNA dihydrouridine(20/20a) synthase DusA [Psychrobacter sanguinis]MCD9152506.1 tRNA dihydrouridine(20/20a) synthase DusA [Psychrobacter sanguinis]UEC24575.1 tRNA dihydrouridine(20/20a) synthase DusA [Psychrobacter sanguinis]
MSQSDSQNIMINKRLSIAPMIDWTTTDYRFFARLFNPHTYLYTEMISTGAIINGNTDRLLRFDNTEHPLVLQLGGADIGEMTHGAVEAQKRGFDEVNINVGCPSDRVQHNKIGACLMAEPETVASLVRHMQAEVDIPVTVKHRIGIDEHDSYQFMKDFVQASAEAGCQRFIVHARIAWLKGLSPKENREIPPLRYDDVYRLKQEFPELQIEINGGIDSLEQIKSHLQHVDGVMIGRAAYHNPYLLAEAMQLWGEEAPSREYILSQLYPYLEKQVAKGEPLTSISRHLLGLFQGLPGARRWRQSLSGKQQLTVDDLKAAGDATLASIERARQTDLVTDYNH